MSERQIPEELLSQIERDRELIEQELPALADRDARMREAAAEDTLCGHLRQAIHRSRRPLRDIAREVGISTTVLCDFLEGERTLRSDVLDRLAQAVGVTISLVPHATQ
jgi:DNA-binding phage protein